jgi:hypothetical protein
LGKNLVAELPEIKVEKQKIAKPSLPGTGNEEVKATVRER